MQRNKSLKSKPHAMASEYEFFCYKMVPLTAFAIPVFVAQHTKTDRRGSSLKHQWKVDFSQEWLLHG